MAIVKIGLIHVALVALVALELFHVLVRVIDAFAALFLHDFAKRGIHVFRHAARIAAHEEMRVVGFEPFPYFRGVLHHPVLHVNLVRLIARPRAIESCQNAIALEAIEIFPIGVVATLSLRAEEEPVLAFCADGLSIL